MFRSVRIQSIGIFASAALFAGAASAQVTPEQEISQYDQPEQCRCFFIRDRAVPGAGRAPGGPLTAEEEIALYDAPQQCECFFEQDRLVMSDPEVTGTIIVRRYRAPTAEEMGSLYQD